MLKHNAVVSRRTLTWDSYRRGLAGFVLCILPIAQASALDVTNESTRGLVETGNDRMIVGFEAKGSGTQQFLLFGVGPTLEDSGLSGVLPDPEITLVNNTTGANVSSNDNWKDHPSALLTAQALLQMGVSIDDLDAAMVLDLAAGSYTLIVEGVDGTTGTALGGVAKTSVSTEELGLVEVDISDVGVVITNPDIGQCAGPGTCQMVAPEGSQVTFIAIPGEDYVFDDWDGCLGNSVSDPAGGICTQRIESNQTRLGVDFDRF